MRSYLPRKFLGPVFGRTDFPRIFIFGPPDFFADFLAGFFLLIFVGKSAQKNPPGKSPAKSSEIYTTKIPDTFLQRVRPKSFRQQPLKFEELTPPPSSLQTSSPQTNGSPRAFYQELGQPNNNVPTCQKRKVSPKTEVFGRTSLRTSGQKLRSGPPNPGKNKHLGTDMPRGRPRKNFGLKNFGLMFRSLTWSSLCPIFWPFLRSPAQAWTIKAVRGTVAIKGIFHNQKGPRSVSVTGGGGPCPLRAYRFPLQGGSVRIAGLFKFEDPSSRKLYFAVVAFLSFFFIL